MFEKERALILTFGTHCSHNNGIPLTTIKKECKENGLILDEILVHMGKIPCFKLQSPTDSKFLIKGSYKDFWEQTINKYFDDLIHQTVILQKQEIKIDLSIAEMRRNKWLSISAICVSILSLFLGIINLIMNLK